MVNTTTGSSAKPKYPVSMNGVKRLGVTGKEYRDWEAISQSDLKSFHANPQLWHETTIQKLWTRTGPTNPQLFGIHAERCLREGLGAVVVAPAEVLASNGARRGNKWDEWSKANEHKIICTPKDADRARSFERVFINVAEHEKANPLVFAPTAEWSTRWLWHRDELPLKGELDIVHQEDGIIVDVKTSAAPDYRHFQTSIEDFGYDVQAACYLSAMEQRHGRGFHFFWVVIRNTRPYDVEVYAMSPNYRMRGIEKYEKYLREFVEARDADYWRSPTHNLAREIEPPRWAKAVHDE